LGKCNLIGYNGLGIRLREGTEERHKSLLSQLPRNPLHNPNKEIQIKMKLKRQQEAI
jgi:hypothetical protein